MVLLHHRAATFFGIEPKSDSLWSLCYPSHPTSHQVSYFLVQIPDDQSGIALSKGIEPSALRVTGGRSDQ